LLRGLSSLAFRKKAKFGAWNHDGAAAGQFLLFHTNLKATSHMAYIDRDGCLAATFLGGRERNLGKSKTNLMFHMYNREWMVLLS
jgi:hypothetical protein